MLKRALAPMLALPKRGPILTLARAGGGATLIGVLALAVSGCERGHVRTRHFGLERPKVLVTSSFEKEKEDRSTRFSESEEDTNTITEEMEIRTRGFVYHPALMNYSLDLRPKYKLQATETGNDSERDDELLFLGYTFDSTYLEQKPLTMKLFSSRNRSEFDSTLSPDSITDTAVDRAIVMLKPQPLPTTLTAERRVTDFEGFNDFRDTSYLARADIRHETDASSTFVKPEFIQQDREFETSDFSIDRYLLNARNLYRFSDDARLFSNFFGNRTESELTGETTNLNASENLLLQHTPNFSSDFQGRYDWRDEEDFTSETVIGTGTFRHKLYENLTTTLRTEGKDEDFTGGDIRTYQGDLDFRYQRRIPWGSIGLNNGYGVRLEDNSVVVGRVPDERLVLTGTDLAFLQNSDVELESIVVTDRNENPFREGPDYVVTQVGDSVAISRTGVGSNIPDGATVFVAYRYEAEPPFKLYNTGIRFGGSLHLWDRLKLFYNFARSQDHFVSGTRPSVLTDDTIQRTGAEFKWRWSTTEAEYEDRDTTRTPLTRWTVRETLSFQPGRRLSLGLSAGHSETKLTDSKDETRQDNANAVLRWRPFNAGEFSLNAFGRRTRGDVQRTDDLGLLALLRWRYGLWSGSISFEALQQEDHRNDQDRDRQTLFLELTREF